MSIQWTKDGKVDRSDFNLYSAENELADALDECVAALREISINPADDMDENHY